MKRPLVSRIKSNILKWAIISLLSITLVMIVQNGLKYVSPEGNVERLFYNEFRNSVTKQISVNFMPVLSFLNNGVQTAGLIAQVENELNKRIPFFYLSELEYKREPAIEDIQTRDYLIRQEGRDEDNKILSESELDYGDNALHIEDLVFNNFLSENTLPSDESPEAGPVSPENYGVFVPPQHPVYTYDFSGDFTYKDLIENFYAIDPTTNITEAQINLDNLLYRDLSINRNTPGPQILIYHTHSLEAFADSIPGDSSTTIVGAGARLAEILRTEYGYNVLHHTEQFDQIREQAYAKAEPVIERLLKDNPTIEVVIDLHRDEMRAGYKLLMDVQGRPTARFMFFNGLSYHNQTGPIEYLPNPYIDENLAFSFQAQVKTNEYYPGLARKIYLRAYRYNMHVLPRTTLIELGAQTNTIEEIMNACEPLAHVLHMVLQ